MDRDELVRLLQSLPPGSRVEVRRYDDYARKGEEYVYSEPTELREKPGSPGTYFLDAY